VAEYAVKVNGSSTEAVELTFFVDGRFVGLSAQPQPTSSEVQLEIDPSLGQVTLFGLQNLSSFTLSMDDESAPESHLVTITGTPLSESENVEISFDGNQAKLVYADGGLQYSLGLENSAGQVFASGPLTLEANETHALRSANWAELNSAKVALEIDQDSDGTTDKTLELENRSPVEGDRTAVCPCPLAVIGFVGLVLVSLRRPGLVHLIGSVQ